MKTPALALLALALLLPTASLKSSPPYDPYSPREPYPLSIKGQTITINKICVGTSSSTSDRHLQIYYVPSTTSSDMWDHIVEMYDVAQHFVPLANDEGSPKIDVVPLLEAEENRNTHYTYSVADKAVAVSDWRVEFQPWFRKISNRSAHNTASPATKSAPSIAR